TDNLIKLWSRIGYEYNRKRSGLALHAVQYLKHKQRLVELRESAASTALILADQGVSRREIIRRLVGPFVNVRFIERSLYEGRQTQSRVGERFETFQDFCRKTSGDTTAGFVWERIASIEPVEDFDGEVYDFTVDHADHNFVANGFVVSNCGVRLVRSNLY